MINDIEKLKAMFEAACVSMKSKHEESERRAARLDERLREAERRAVDTESAGKSSSFERGRLRAVEEQLRVSQTESEDLRRQLIDAELKLKETERRAMTAELKFRELEFTTTASLSANDALVRRLEEEVKERAGHLKRLEDDLRAEHQQCMRLEQQLQQQQQTYEQHRQLQTLERQDQRIQQLQEQSRSQSHVSAPGALPVDDSQAANSQILADLKLNVYRSDVKYQESECRLQITERRLLEVEEKYRSLLAEKVSLLSEKKMLETHNHRLASIEEKHRAVSAENAGLSARIATLASENASLLAEKRLLEGQNNRILSVEEAVRSHQKSVQDLRKELEATQELRRHEEDCHRKELEKAYRKYHTIRHHTRQLLRAVKFYESNFSNASQTALIHDGDVILGDLERAKPLAISADAGVPAVPVSANLEGTGEGSAEKRWTSQRRAPVMKSDIHLVADVARL
eukprot:gene939-1056_t